MYEIFLAVLGGYYCYSLIHLIVLQWKSYKDRTNYEAFVTWFSLACTALTIIGIMME